VPADALDFEQAYIDAVYTQLSRIRPRAERLLDELQDVDPDPDWALLRRVRASREARCRRSDESRALPSPAVSTFRRIVLVLIAIVVGTGLYYAFRPYDWSAQLQTPAGVKQQVVKYTCGPLWGPGYVHGPATVAYPFPGTPCGERTQYEVMDGVDVALGALGAGFLLVWPAVKRQEKAPADAG
jgi:hypothetical protein